MKCLFAVFLVSLVGFSNCAEWSSHPSLQILNDVLRTDHHDSIKRSARQQRQTSSAEDFQRCTAVVARATCETDFIRNSVNAASNCGHNDLAELSALECSTNHNGEYCAVVVSREVQDFVDVNINCASANESSCPSECASALRAIRNSFGCCVHLYNETFSNVVQILLPNLLEVAAISQFFNYTLWSACDVETVGQCSNIPTVTRIHESPVCSTQQVLQSIAEVECGSEGQEVVDILLQEDKCYPLARAVIDVCAANSDGEYCIAGTMASQALLNPVVAPGVTTHCSMDQQSCSPECRAAIIEELRDNFGCCVNSHLNGTLSGAYPLETSYDLWRQCDVEIPGPCESTLNGSPAIAKAMSLMWISVLATLLLYAML